MKVTISFLHLEHTDALDERIQEKTGKLEKYLGKNSQVKWCCYVKEGNHYAEVALIGPNFNYHAHGFTDNLYKTIDVVVEKLEKQLSKHKAKTKERRKRSSKKELKILEPEIAWADYDEDYYKDAA